MSFPDPTTGDAKAFERWLLDSTNPGSAFHYAKGVWLDERHGHDSSRHSLPEATRHLATLAWLAYQNGRVMLVQRRDDDRLFSYLAIKRHVFQPQGGVAQPGRGRIR